MDINLGPLVIHSIAYITNNAFVLY